MLRKLFAFTLLAAASFATSLAAQDDTNRGAQETRPLVNEPGDKASAEILYMVWYRPNNGRWTAIGPMSYYHANLQLNEYLKMGINCYIARY